MESTSSIDPATHIGLVTLRVADLARALRFYEGILRFRRIQETPSSVLLGAQDGPALLALHELPGATPQPQRATGLYHVAILLPTRADLGRMILNLLEHHWEIGQSDHLVSEAIYISDPDDNGLEIYRDRARSTWHWSNQQVQMALDPLDIPAIIEETTRTNTNWQALPSGTTVGHIHLRVGDIAQAQHFYHDILGFDITAHMPGALFVSAGGYHHHIGLNTWQSRGAAPTPEASAGLQSYEIALPTRAALQAMQEQLIMHDISLQQDAESSRIADPWGNQIKLIVAS